MTLHEEINKVECELALKCFENFTPAELIGCEGGRRIAKWFRDNTDHPHVNYTFRELAHHRNTKYDTTAYFAIGVFEKMAWLVAENQVCCTEEN